MKSDRDSRAVSANSCTITRLSFLDLAKNESTRVHESTMNPHVDAGLPRSRRLGHPRASSYLEIGSSCVN